MVRPKGALNRRTRAALHAAQTGELGAGGESPIEFLLGVMRNSKKSDQLRIDAAKAVAPYFAPKLSAVEVTGNDEAAGRVTEVELMEQLRLLLLEHPELIETSNTLENLTTRPHTLD